MKEKNLKVFVDKMGFSIMMILIMSFWLYMSINTFIKINNENTMFYQVPEILSWLYDLTGPFFASLIQVILSVTGIIYGVKVFYDTIKNRKDYFEKK